MPYPSGLLRYCWFQANVDVCSRRGRRAPVEDHGINWSFGQFCFVLCAIAFGAGWKWRVNVAKRANDTNGVGVIDNQVTNGTETAVGAATDAAFSRLSAAGISVDHRTIPELEDLPHINRMGGIVGAAA